MSKLLNIGASNDDPTYRYKMPPLIVKFEGKGKTVLTNIREVSKALRCDPAYPTQFFGLELGAQSRFDKAKAKTVINGAHAAKDLAQLLAQFITLFVLCPTCHLPEIALSVHKRAIRVDCAACGHNGALNSNHKLEGFILKNPPSAAKTVAVPAAGTFIFSESNTSLSNDNSVEQDDAEWSVDTSDEAVAARRLEETARWNPPAAAAEVLESSSGDSAIQRLAALELSIAPVLRALAARAENAPALVLEIECHKQVFSALCSERAGQLELLGALDCLLDARAELARRAIFLLESLYDWDFIQEDAIVAWYANHETTIAGVNTFVAWLKTAAES